MTALIVILAAIWLARVLVGVRRFTRIDNGSSYDGWQVR